MSVQSRPKGSMPITSTPQHQRFAGEPQRIRAINGAYGIARDNTLQSVYGNSSRTPHSLASTHSASDGVTRIVGHGGLQRRSLPPAARSQVQAHALAQQRRAAASAAQKRFAPRNPALLQGGDVALSSRGPVASRYAPRSAQRTK